MAISAISQSIPIALRDQAGAPENNSLLSTLGKASVVAAGAIASVASFFLLSPIVGGLLAVITGGVGLLLCLPCCERDPHAHHDNHPAPWYHKFFAPHVPVGEGSHPPPAPWYDIWSHFPKRVPVGHGGGGHHHHGGDTTLRPSGPRGHVPVGRG